ncbi:MAG TPA: SDR family NAD(P)-dependent oxidoreductase [Gemmatimonadaceae bacterium]|jgi:3-oxoacyl-[acyl-carrier protein] reductase|nr:SDR family NAD(P)-dependent oxidoreductase [Gemmatimonadaceae bacterium]
MIDLKGKRALVTGGSRGIGRATALLLAECGADVCIGYRSAAADAAEVVAELRGRGVRGEAVAADLGTRAGADHLFDETLQRLGGLDIYVGNAGIWPASDVPLGEMDDTRWRTTMSANLDAIFWTTRRAVSVLPRGGRIVLVTSTAAQRGEAFHADYAASKGAVVSLVKSLAVELGPRDITVNSVAPGWVDTDMSASALRGPDRARIDAGVPLGRVATAEDVAGPIVFLCSAHARHVTGEILNVNGGSVLCG